MAERRTLATRLLRLFLVLPEDDPDALRRRLAGYFPHIDFQRLNLLDLLRIPLQLLWLILVIPADQRPPPPGQWLRTTLHGSPGSLRRAWHRLRDGVARRLSLRGFFEHLELDQVSEKMLQRPLWRHRLSRYLTIGLAAAAIVMCITTPFALLSQALFVVVMWLAALWVRKIPGHLATMMLVALSVTASSRYLWWRFNFTLNWDDLLDLTLGLGLLAAEVYAWLVLLLGYIQTAWPLQREAVNLPTSSSDWPTVDIYIPTYNEPLGVVRPTVFAAMGIDWPQDKINVYLLDDGKRDEFRAFAEEAGVHYMTRPDNSHAKAGNLNHAMGKTDGEFIAIFDCDHIPVRSFLQNTVGWFLKDTKLALIQTPHHFFSPDPFERNLGNFGKVPNENELFYGLIQDGNDLWDATFFCGSCAIIRRAPLEQIGGIAVETVTEDAHTSLRLHRLGYRSAYLRLPQAAGLATESLSAHVGQRIRWARGMAQIFRIDNPMFGKGLSLGQRLCYSNAMLHFLYGVPRLVFLTAPLAFLLLHSYIIYASAISLLLYVMPHIIHASITNSRNQGKYRHSFWAEVYETALAWYIARPTTVALLAPHKGSFNVTAKGGLVEKEHFDWTISKPYIVLVLLNFTAMFAGGARLFGGPEDEIQTVIINMLWTVYNLTMLGAAMAVAAEARQVRVAHRVGISFPLTLHLKNGHVLQGETVDYSEGGLGLKLPAAGLLTRGQRLSISLKRGIREFVFPVEVVSARGQEAGVRFDNLSAAQEKDLVQATFGRADAWLSWGEGREPDRPLRGFMEMASTGMMGYVRLFRHLKPLLEPLAQRLGWLPDFIRWLMPRNPVTVR